MACASVNERFRRRPLSAAATASSQLRQLGDLRRLIVGCQYGIECARQDALAACIDSSGADQVLCEPLSEVLLLAVTSPGSMMFNAVWRRIEAASRRD